MQGWPPIDNAELRERLALDDEAFLAYLVAMTGALGRREFTEEMWALGYPWARPPRSYLLVGEEVRLLDDMPEEERRAVLDDAPRGRWPVLAFGSNGAPEALVRKFGHLAEAKRRVLACRRCTTSTSAPRPIRPSTARCRARSSRARAR